MGDSLIDKIKQKNKRQSVAPRKSEFEQVQVNDENIISDISTGAKEAETEQPRSFQPEQVEMSVKKQASLKNQKNSSSRSSSSLEIKTAKPKLLTLEETIHQRIEQICYENPSVSRDTLIESLLIIAEQSGRLSEVLELASERLTNRKKSAVRRRVKTMSEKFLGD